jgi:hypothetical protein
MGRIHSFEEFNRINEERLTSQEEQVMELQDSLEEVTVDENEDSLNEKLDGEELLSAKQKKLPEALKKSIIAKLKKQKPAKDEEEDDDKEDKKGKDDDKENKKDDSDKSDEEKYLTPKQRKLPEGIKKSIIAKAKKK